MTNTLRVYQLITNECQMQYYPAFVTGSLWDCKMTGTRMSNNNNNNNKQSFQEQNNNSAQL